MDYNNTNPLACISNTKDACLYFERVIPLNLAQVIPWQNNGDLEAFDILKKILPASLLDTEHHTGLGPMMLLYIDTYVDVFPGSIGIEKFRDRALSSKRAKTLAPLLFNAGVYLLNSLPEPISSVFGAGEIQNTDVKRNDPAFILTGLTLIDTRKITWREIVAIREDKESINKLRRLRTFVFENYQDKPLNFIKDDLLNRIENYQNTAKQWGFKTNESVMKIIFNSGSALSVTAATIASLISGNPLSVSLPLSIGSTFLIGNIALEIGSHKRAVHSFKQENPITYLVDIVDNNR
jgi:hypothetical protein